jgi:hypothetical protein
MSVQINIEDITDAIVCPVCGCVYQHNWKHDKCPVCALREQLGKVVFLSGEEKESTVSGYGKHV